MRIGLFGVYEEPGAQAIFAGKSADDKVKIKGIVNTKKPGTYKVTYEFAAIELERIVVVESTMNPALLLSGQEEVSRITLGEDFQEPGYEAYDHKQLAKMTHLELFQYPVWDREFWKAVCMQTESYHVSEEPTFVLFDYRERDSLTGDARTVILN